jgi:hypothetical protein
MTGAYRKSSTWTRIGVGLAILAGLLLLPALVSTVSDLGTEAPLPAVQDHVELRANHRYRLIDDTGDGRVDCILRIPALPWARVGFYRDRPAGRCRGSRTRPMPPAMIRLADELLSRRRQAGLSLGVLRDVDGDGRVDCVEYDGTWRYTVGVACPEALRSDAAVMDEEQSKEADRILAVERELRSRWLGADPG